MATSNLEISINHVLKSKITSLFFFFWHLAAHLDGMVVSFLEEQALGKSHGSGVLRLVCHSALLPWMVRGGFPMGARLPTYKMASINHSFKNTRIWVFIKSVCCIPAFHWPWNEVLVYFLKTAGNVLCTRLLILRDRAALQVSCGQNT